MKKIPLLLSAVALTTGVSLMAGADTDESELQSLKQALQALQKRVEALEAVKPTFTGFMPNIAERFHVMHRAGEAGDWAVAGHELEEIKRLTALSGNIDAKYGELMQGMMGSSYEVLDGAIEHGNQEKFEAALDQTVNACNACHTATGSEFVQVVLDAETSISMRHPHALSEREIAGGHSHGDEMPKKMMSEGMMSEGMMSGGMMSGEDAPDDKDKENDKDEHGHGDEDKHQD